MPAPVGFCLFLHALSTKANHIFCIADEDKPASSHNFFACSISALFIVFKLIYGGLPMMREYLSSFTDAY